MRIKRILNNNAVLCLDENNEEVIIKGKGIAYGSSAGDMIHSSKIDQIFVLSNKEINRKYQELLVTIPGECIEVSEKAIQIIKEETHDPLNDTIYITLTDHISNLLERTNMGIVFDNTLLWDVKRMYQKEYKAGLKVVEIIRQFLDINVSDDEASFIALHIVNARMNVAFEDVYKIMAMVEDIYTLVEEEFDLQVDKDGLEYSRFIIHLRFFLERIITKKSISIEKNNDILEALKKEYPKQYSCVEKIAEYVNNWYQEPVHGEILYLLIHVIKLTT